VPAQESYPDDLKYHAEHDWARIGNGEAILGVTWWAQDALGELVKHRHLLAGAQRDLFHGLPEVALVLQCQGSFHSGHAAGSLECDAG